MADWFDSIEIFDEIAFDDGPLETPTTWYDISDSVLEFRTFVGKTSLDTEFAPGYGTLVLDNSSGDFTPENTNGNYYPDVKPMRRFRRTVTVGMATYTVFTGYVLSWDQDWRTRTSYVTVPLVDATRFVENSPLPSSAYAAEVTADDPLLYLPLQNGNRAADVTGNGYDIVGSGNGGAQISTADEGLPLGEPLAITSSTVGSTDPGVDFVHPSPSVTPKTVEMWAKVSSGGSLLVEIWNSDDDTGMSTQVGDSGASTFVSVEYSSLSENRNGSTSANVDVSTMRHIVVTGGSTAVKVYVNGAEVASVATSVGTALNFSAYGAGYFGFQVDSTTTVSHLAVYESTLSAARIQAHYEAGRSAWGDGHAEFGGDRIKRALDDVGFPSGSRDVDTGQTIHGSYLPAGFGLLDYLRQVERAEQGILYFGGDGSITFRDRQSLSSGAGSVIFSDDETDITGGAIEYVAGNPRGNPIDHIRNIVTASYASTGGITRRDTTSVTDYGESRVSLDTPTLPDGQAASNLAAFVVRERKDPKSVYPALTVEMRPNTEDKMHELFSLELGSVVTVRRTPFDLANEIESTAVVLGVGHENVGSSGQWYMTLYLAPALTQYNDADTPLLRVGSGGDTNKIGAAAGNTITY